MARKSALVVDDSKSARVILSRMLEKYDIEVDTAESAEQAIEYLNNHRPDAIFMDHLMPGMDGLQAVQAIKGNPETATIPIMMYTSQEGELYVGQARALGAMGVLPKQVRPVDVSKVLYELHLLPDRRDSAEPALAPVELDAAAGAAGAAAGTGERRSAGPDWGRRVETTVKETGADIRRFIVASLDSFASRIVTDVRDALPAPAPPEPAAAPPAVPKPPVWPWAAALGAATLIAAACAAMWAGTREDLTKVRADLAALTAANQELQRSRNDLASTVKDLTSALAANVAAASAPAPNGTPSPRVEAVPYGEIPFDKSRFDVLRDYSDQSRGAGLPGHRQGHQFVGIVLPQRKFGRWFHAGPRVHAPEPMRSHRQPVRRIADVAAAPVAGFRQPGRESAAARGNRHQRAPGERGQLAARHRLSPANRHTDRGRVESRGRLQQSRRVHRRTELRALKGDPEEHVRTLGGEVEHASLRGLGGRDVCAHVDVAHAEGYVGPVAVQGVEFVNAERAR